ncbi:RNA dependent RNA polymerase-domain-containing protein [Cristinia sonorae]|uniref:RNA dependent RNA polymerase-domain-containing protein n=1 Tax=Cristinia sonorae TaxID=1940300 RepID=A0A8K0UHA8_9AGAR|nr:RNA dependent RNA polymerase-domain-containing protein [Cristinia sonorae]
MPPLILREPLSPDDDSWEFTIPQNAVQASRPNSGKHISFTPQRISFQLIQFPNNRILQEDDTQAFLLASFEQLRFPDTGFSATRDYMMRVFQKGVFINGVQYRFYGHSNSQLRSRSCFLRQATNDVDLDRRIYALGNFEGIKNAAKRAKRIGLLFSEAKIDWVLDPERTRDIPDIERSGENFSDGCGLISRTFAVLLSRHKRIIFRGRPYTPCVYQIRYRGYKGVLMLHPELGVENIHVHFRKSQRKFLATRNDTFSVVNYSAPYTFARLNNEIVALLSSLGVTNDRFLAKQNAYHEWIMQASDDWEVAFDLVSGLGRFQLAERLLLEGIDSPAIRAEINRLQQSEVTGFKKKDRTRVRTLLSKSRFLFGVCDPYSVLQEGEVHVRVTIPRKGAATLTNVDVLVVRNPCLHPGDCLKLRAVSHPKLSHLVDCVVFATRGRRAAPSMSSGGDLDGDQFTVIWDADLVPPHIAESYTYPPGREHISNNITREDLARHFASYNSISLGRITALHSRWMRYSPRGAMSDECQELNALHSSVVDGASIKIPDRLKNIPDKPKEEGAILEPFVLDVLHEHADEFEEKFRQRFTDRSGVSEMTLDMAESMVVNLLSSEKLALSEYETVVSAAALARMHGIDLVRYVSHIDFSALSTSERHAVSTLLNRTPQQAPYIWNSLIRSDILRPRDLEDRSLGGPLHLQRLYSSTIQGRAAFFEYLKEAIEDFRRRLIIVKTDDRFSVGIFVRGAVSWNDEPGIDDNVMVCSFMPQSSISSSTYKRGTKGYKLHCSDNALQLYNKQRGDTFIFMTRPPEKSGADIIASIALQKISDHVRRQCGRLQRTPVVTLEIHVVSNRDRIGQQAFDLRFEHVQTEQYLRRFDHRPQPYTPNSLFGFNWQGVSGEQQVVFLGTHHQADLVLGTATDDTLLEYFHFAMKYRCEDRAFWIFDALLAKENPPVALVEHCMDIHPPLVYSLLKRYMIGDLESGRLPDSYTTTSSTFIHSVFTNVIRCSNELGIAALVALEKLALHITDLAFPVYAELLWLTAMSVRAKELVQEIMLVLHECRNDVRSGNPVQEYGHKHSLAVVFDRAEDAGDTCPCDDQGRPRRQRVAPPTPETPHGEEESHLVMAHIRVDAITSVRIHSHVRLQVSSPPEHSTLPPAIVDAVVLRASRGELLLSPFHPLPPEHTEVTWNMYDAGSVATSRAMLDAIQKLVTDGFSACRFHKIVTAQGPLDPDNEDVPAEAEPDPGVSQSDQESLGSLNDSQRRAVLSTQFGRLSLIWGPPGTGKTTVVVQILLRFLRQSQDPELRILMTASTHNAVDNVLERFVAEVARSNSPLLTEEQILRAATDGSRVNKALQKYTIDARLGGSISDNPKLVQKAERRVKQARIVFTTCTGAGLGIIRKMEFKAVLIDEASQITEPGALIPLVKGCTTAVLVGDHVQLRPITKPMGKALEYDKSLFERLWKGPAHREMSRTMLDVQYRFSAEVAHFPSNELYEGRLQTGNPRVDDISSALAPGSFPWPQSDTGQIISVVFVPCRSEEDYGRSSKSNTGQADLAKYILTLLRTPHEAEPNVSEVLVAEITRRLQTISVALLTPYSRQVKLLTEKISLNDHTVVSTIDGFQGRESDVVIFSTVRSNMERDIGFVEDERRLNVAWTRPKLALIIIGDSDTLCSNGMWGRAIQACRRVEITLPEPPA